MFLGSLDLKGTLLEHMYVYVYQTNILEEYLPVDINFANFFQLNKSRDIWVRDM